MIITFHISRSNYFSLQKPLNSPKFLHTFFHNSHQILHQSRWFLFDPYSTSGVDELFQQIRDQSLLNLDCWKLTHPWQFHDSRIWSIFELSCLLQSTSTSLIFICFGFLDLEARNFNSCHHHKVRTRSRWFSKSWCVFDSSFIAEHTATCKIDFHWELL